MDERFSEILAESEITPSAKLGFIKRVRDLAPFDPDRINKVDQFGCYETCFLYGEEDYVSVYIPGLAGVEVEGEIIESGVCVAKRISEDLDNGLTIVHTYSYTVDEISLDARYTEAEHVFETDTGKRVGPKLADDLDVAIETAKMELQYRVSPVFTDDRLQEVTDILDSIDPTDTFKY